MRTTEQWFIFGSFPSEVKAYTPATMLSISLPRLTSRINALARFGALAGRGATRPCWSPPHEEARAWLLGGMRAAGLETWGGTAGNIFGATGIRAFGRDAPVGLPGSPLQPG